MIKNRTFYVYKGQIREDNDCVLRAIEYVLDLSYYQVEEVCSRYGYDGEGMTLEQTMLSLWELTDKQPQFKNLKKDNIKVSEAKFLNSLLVVKNHTEGLHIIGYKNSLDLSMAKHYLDSKVIYLIYP